MPTIEEMRRLRRRKQRLGNHGLSQRHRTHEFVGTAGVGVTPIDTDAVFPSRQRPIVLETRIRITANGGIHRGLVFEFGSSTRGAACWVGDQTIGLVAGGLTTEQAVATWDFGAELSVGREFQLTCFINPGKGHVRLYDHGLELARADASAGNFNGDWADAEDGSFASALVTTITPGVPVASQIAPSGFDVIKALWVFDGSTFEPYAE